MHVTQPLQRLGSLIFGVVLSGTLMGAQLVDATTYYVATTGNDANPGTATSPFRTINRGIKVLKPGDTLRVRSGTYAEALYNPLPSGLSASEPTTLEGDPAPNWPVLKPTTSTYGSIIQINKARAHVRFRNLVLDGRAHTGKRLVGAFQVSSDPPSSNVTLENCEAIGRYDVHSTGAAMGGNPNFWTVRNCKIHGWRSWDGNVGHPGAHGFYWRGRNGLIERVEIYDVNGYGIQFYSSSCSDCVNNNIFRNNYIHDVDPNSNGGIYCCKGSGNQIYNNLLVRNRNGITVSSSSKNNLIYNNTIYANTRKGILIGGGTAIIRNNIVYQNGGGNIGLEGTSGSSITYSHNLCGSSGTGCQFVADPKFVNATGGSFRLQSSSPAINKGVTLSNVRTDFAGTARPQSSAYDIGAYEYLSSTTSTSFSAPTNLQILSTD